MQTDRPLQFVSLHPSCPRSGRAIGTPLGLDRVPVPVAVIGAERAPALRHLEAVQKLVAREIEHAPGNEQRPERGGVTATPDRSINMGLRFLGQQARLAEILLMISRTLQIWRR